MITEDEIIVGLDSKQRFATDGVYVFGVRDEYDPLFIMGILNSRFFVFVYRLLSLENGRVLAQVKPTTLKQLPIPIINPSAATETTRRERIAFLAKQMIVLNEKAQNARAAHDKTVLQRQIEATDRQIDRLVYELYDLTEEEIAIVESQT